MSGGMSHPRHLQIGDEDRQPGGDGRLLEDTFLADAGLI
jgi:hypothetical protein